MKHRWIVLLMPGRVVHQDFFDYEPNARKAAEEALEEPDTPYTQAHICEIKVTAKRMIEWDDPVAPGKIRDVG